MKKITGSFISITLMLVITDLSVFPAFSSPIIKKSDNKKDNNETSDNKKDKNPYLDKNNSNKDKKKDKDIEEKKKNINPYIKDSNDKTSDNLEIKKDNSSSNIEEYKDYYNKVLFELGFRQGVAINYPSNLSKFGFQGYNPGVGLSIDYYLFKNLGVHFEGTSFFTSNSFSIFIPASLRYKFVTSPRFDLFIGLGGFGNYYNSKFSGGALGELGIMYKATSNFSLNTTIDMGHNLIPEQATSAGLRFGGAFSL